MLSHTSRSVHDCRFRLESATGKRSLGWASVRECTQKTRSYLSGHELSLVGACDTFAWMERPATDYARLGEPQQLPRIFDRFYSSPDHSDRDQAGLGLAIVKRIIDLHGQSVRVLSGKGTGTTVEFSLARATALSLATAGPHESITEGPRYSDASAWR